MLAGLDEDLQRCCASFLDTTSAGRFGQASWACKALVDGQLVAAKAARAAAALAAPFENSLHGNMVAYRNPTDDSKLITFLVGLQFTCACDAHARVFKSGRSSCNVVRHLASKRHWSYWRLVAYGETQPTQAAWLAFTA